MLVAFAACLFASESHAQFIQRGGIGTSIARAAIVRSSPALRIGSLARSGIQRSGGFGGARSFGGVQGFQASPQRFGPQFGNGGGINAGRIFRVGRIISGF